MAGQPRAHKVVQALANEPALSTAQLAEATGIPRKQMAAVCENLRQRGYVARIGTGLFKATKAGKVFAESGETIKSGPCRPHTGRRIWPETLRTRAWRAMGIMEKFTIADLVTVAGTGGEARPEDNLQRYLRVLARCGYVVPLKAREQGTKLTSPGFLRFLRLKHTGPQAPVHSQRRKTLFDPNTEELFDLKEAGDV